MGYLYLAISKFCGAAKMAAMKKCGNSSATVSTSVRVNAVRSTIIVIVSAIVFAAARAATADGLWIAALSGVCNGVNMLTWLICATVSSLCFVEIFCMIGSVVVPLAASPLLFPNEPISVLQWVGAAVILAAVVTFTVGQKIKLGRGGAVWITLCALSSAGLSITSKLYRNAVGEEYTALFNLVTFVIVLAFFLAAELVLAIRAKRRVATVEVNANDPESAANGLPTNESESEDKTEEKRVKTILGLEPKTYFWIAIAAVGMYAVSYFNTLAGVLDAGILYPLSYGTGFLLTAIMDAAIFRQPLTPARVAGTVLAVVGSVLAAL